MRILEISTISDDKSSLVAGTDESSNFDLLKDLMTVIDIVVFMDDSMGFSAL